MRGVESGTVKDEHTPALSATRLLEGIVRAGTARPAVAPYPQKVAVRERE